MLLCMYVVQNRNTTYNSLSCKQCAAVKMYSSLISAPPQPQTIFLPSLKPIIA